MPLTTDKEFSELGKRISQLAGSGIDDALNNFSARVLEIKKLSCDKKRRHELFAKLEITFSLFCHLKKEEIKSPAGCAMLLGFFEKLGEIRHNFHNYFAKQRVDSLAELAASVDLERLNPQQKMEFAKSLNQIGFPVFPNKPHAQSFLNECLQSLDSRSYKGAGWVRNAMHFLTHCKNLNLLGAENLDEANKKLFAKIIREAAKFIAENDFSLNESTAQASLDVLRYANHVLKIETREDAKKILQHHLRDKKDYSSEVHLKIFEKIIKFLKNKQGGEDEWQHLPELKDRDFIYGGILEIGVEKPYGDGLHGDIVVRDKRNGRIILAIEVDGSPHFLSPELKTGKTRARDEVAVAMLGAQHFMTIDEKDFSLFQDGNSLKELAFLRKIQSILQDHLDKTSSAQKPKKVELKMERKTAIPAAAAPTAQAAPAPAAAPAAALPARPKQKSKTEIQTELLEGFWQILRSAQPENIEEILSEEIFAEIAPERIIGGGGHPFDFILQKYHEAGAEEKENLKLTLNLLWIYGFEPHDKKLANPLTSSAGVVAAPNKSDLDFVLKYARAGNFNLAKFALRRHPLPKVLTKENEDELVELTKLVILSRQKDSEFSAKIEKSSWFNAALEALLVEALENSNDKLAQTLLERKSQTPEFCCAIFRRNPELIAKIFDFKLIFTIGGFMANLQHDKALHREASLKCSQTNIFSTPETKAFYKGVLELKDKSPETLYIKAQLYYSGLAGVEKDIEKCKALCKEAAKSRHFEASLLLADIYMAEGNQDGAVKIYKKILPQDSDGRICYALAKASSSQEEFIGYVRKGAQLGHGWCLLIHACEYRDGSPDIKKDANEALRLFQKAVEAGEEGALHEIGGLYNENLVDGLSKEESREKALETYLKVRGEHRAASSYNIGNIYLQKFDEAARKPSGAKSYKPEELQNCEELLRQSLTYYTLSQEIGATATDELSRSCVALAASMIKVVTSKLEYIAPHVDPNPKASFQPQSQGAQQATATENGARGNGY